MVTITLRGREIPLLYTTQEMLTIQEEIAPIGQVIAMITGRNPDDKKDLLEPEAVELFTTPYEIAGFKEAIMDCLMKGTKRDVESEPEKNA